MGKKAERNAERKAAAIARRSAEEAIDAAAEGDDIALAKALPLADMHYKHHIGAPHCGSSVFSWICDSVFQKLIGAHFLVEAYDRIEAAGVDIRNNLTGPRMTTLMLLCVGGNADLIKRALPQSDIRAVDASGRDAEAWAIMHNREDLAELIRGYELSVHQEQELTDILPPMRPSKTRREPF